MGYTRGFIHGTVVGAIAGLCLAPQEGVATRAQVRAAAGAARSGFTRAQSAATRVAPAVGGGAQRMIVVVGKARGLRKRGGAAEPPGGIEIPEAAPAPGEQPAGAPDS